MLHLIGHFDLEQWLLTIGYAGMLGIIFAETGLFFGFFLPGDSLIFTAGILAARGIFHLSVLIPSLIIAAVLGYQVGYWLGKRLGHWLMQRKDSVWFKKRYIEQAHQFYEKHGGQAMILCRIVPIVRTFCPIVAGMAGMPMKRYLSYNVIGASLWVVVMSLIGYFVGNVFPKSQKLILPMVLVIIVLSVLPGVYHYWKQRKVAQCNY